MRCRIGSKPCRTSRGCVLYSHVCDGEEDCQDGSDEEGCAVHCEEGEFGGGGLIFNQPVIHLRSFGFRTVFEILSSPPGEFRCSHGNRCVSLKQVCDGQYDCQDRSDEMDCSEPSAGCHLRCDNKTRCVPETFLCDGERDCADGSDEEKCGKRFVATRIRTSSAIARRWFLIRLFSRVGSLCHEPVPLCQWSVCR